MRAMPEADVRCGYVDGSGGYGRNGHEDAAADAALLARAAGRPVRVQWMRADEHGWDPTGPPTLIDLHGGLDGDGQPRRGQEPDRGNIVQTTILF
jgi:CO/xanthine dehydrogenase Mo-binding subunit